MSGVHLVRAAAVDLHGRGLLLMGGPGSGLSTQLWRLVQRPGVRLVSADALLIRYTAGEALCDLPERKLYLKTKWAVHHGKLPGLFDQSHLENVLTGAHATERCDGGERCPVTRGQGACYTGSGVSRALMDPYWLGGTRQHARRTSAVALALLGHDAVGGMVNPLSPEEALSTLQHVQVGHTTVPWFNEHLMGARGERAEAQRALFGRLLSAARPVAVNTAYADPDQVADALLRLMQ